MSATIGVEIHPTAVVSPDVRLGEGVKIGAYAVIDDDVEIGDGTEIFPHVTIGSYARIGKNCRIFPNAVISMPPQDLKFVGEKTYVIVGDHTTIRECVTLNRGTAALGKTVIGSNCLLMAYTHVAHDCIIGDHVIISNTVQLGGHVEIGDYVTIGGVCGIHQFTRIGRHAMVSALSKLVHDVPPYVTVAHDRYEGLNLTGLKRRGFTSETINNLKDIYRVIFQSGMMLKSALDKVQSEIAPSPLRDEILHFFESGGKRKFIRPFTVSAEHE
jgi:UDP-N-acetylglucosamine acyltransferase